MNETYYKLLIREKGRLRSYNDSRIVWYDDGVWVRDVYPLFVFRSEADAMLLSKWTSLYEAVEIWTVACENARKIQYGRARESYEEFWSDYENRQYKRTYKAHFAQFDNQLPYGTLICDSLRLIERIL